MDDCPHLFRMVSSTNHVAAKPRVYCEIFELPNFLEPLRLAGPLSRHCDFVTHVTLNSLFAFQSGTLSARGRWKVPCVPWDNVQGPQWSKATLISAVEPSQ